MKNLIFRLWVSVIFVSPACYAFAQPAADIPQASNQFAFDLYAQLSKGNDNIFFSPYSLSSALIFVYEGARLQTADEMRTVLHLPSDETDWQSDLSESIRNYNAPHKGYELSVANALWVQKSYLLKSDYLNLVKNTYLAQAQNLDFITNPESARGKINDWVSDKTNHHINDLLPPQSITPDTRLVLTDAVYFKGQWVAPFEQSNTRLDTFWLTSNQSTQTQMMGLEEINFNYFADDQLQVLQLPYQGHHLSMLIILPRSKDIQDFEKTLSADVLKQWQAGLTVQEVNVFLPKFKMDWEDQMSDNLKGMGMLQAFDPNRADFSGMSDKTPQGNLYIDKVFHKAWIKVDEQGTEAAAATAVVVAKALAMQVSPQLKIFRANHPFIFMIQDDKTGQILFMGRVTDPREK